MESRKLEGNSVDTWTAITKGVLGAIPMAGPLLSEIVSSRIPNQRLDRVRRFLLELDKRLSTVELEQLKQNTLALDLFEDATVIASRALTELRNQHVVSFIKSAVLTDDTEYDLKKKLIYILQDLTDRDIEILQSIKEIGYDSTAANNYPGHITAGAFDKLSECEKMEYNSREEVWPLHISILERNGLLKAQREEQDVDNFNYHIDSDTGLPRINYYEVSKLGDIFLSSISSE